MDHKKKLMEIFKRFDSERGEAIRLYMEENKVDIIDDDFVEALVKIKCFILTVEFAAVLNNIEEEYVDEFILDFVKASKEVYENTYKFRGLYNLVSKMMKISKDHDD